MDDNRDNQMDDNNDSKLPPAQGPAPSDDTGSDQVDQVSLPPVTPQGPLGQPSGDDQASDDNQAAQQPAQTEISLPEEAADSDLIEKEWVVKAKQIVEHTSDDPFVQASEIAKVKADYLKKRYNRDIELK